MRTPEQEDIARAVAGLAADRSSARRSAEGGPGVDRELWLQLADLGLTGVTLPEAWGGSGASLAEEIVVLEELAAMVAPVPIAAAYIAGHILTAGEGEHCQMLARGLAEGRQIVGPCLSAATGPRVDLAFKRDPDDPNRGLVSGVVSDAADGTAPDVYLVLVDDGWWAIDGRDHTTQRSEVTTIDPSRRLASVGFQHSPAVKVSSFDPAQVERLAWLFTAAEATGVGAAALELMRAYALERRQFGEPIGRFQAIKHKLTDALVSLEGARSAVSSAVSTAANSSLDARSAHMAKTVATASAVTIACEAIQVHGAIGNTWDHDLHLLLRRAKLCQLLFGSSDKHFADLTVELMEASGDRERSTKSWESELQLQDSDRAFLSDLRGWLDLHAGPGRVAAIRKGGAPVRREWQAEMADAGWAGIHWPRAFGGRDAGFVEQVLYHSELAARGLPGLVGNRGLSLVGPTLITHGTPDQQARFVEGTRRGDILWASGMSEPNAGSDLASLRTRARLDGDHLVINGQKTWTSHADHSEMMFTLVRTGEITPKHEGITCVLVPLDSPKLTIRPIRRMHGVVEFFEIFFDDVRVPLSNVVGPIGGGWKVARTTLSHEHMTNFLGAQLRNAFFVDRLIDQLTKSEQISGVDVALRRRVTQAWINTQLLRLHGLRNISRMSQGGEVGAEGSILKLFGQEEERRLFELALDLKGVGGLTAPREVANFLSARAATVGGGTSEVHRNKIAERVLGMPRDLWASE